MKMAKASQADIEMAMELANALEALSSRWGATMPQKIAEAALGVTAFCIDDPEHCRRVCEYLINLGRSASLFRVVMGMAVVLDPRNELLDPDADTLEAHPRIRAALSAIEPLPEGYAKASAAVATEAAVLIERARRAGVVLTIETEPRQPLAMGNYDVVVQTREARKGGAA
ncbi:hypothetical protein [Methyloversatilis discipulorum]|uniref:hypothetical protein n=1 Tax=Methyloversatilis discipulorum TaxID=1119528 RepID=UPI00037B3123|nr:hypothetical protein [Methyloversatilis discipulorum]